MCVFYVIPAFTHGERYIVELYIHIYVQIKRLNDYFQTF